jgi:hypothetical protein
LESAGGVTAMTMADSVTAPLLWHTNHFRYLAAPAEFAAENSWSAAGCSAQSLPGDVDREALLRLLAQQPLPEGVRACRYVSHALHPGH